MIKQILIFLFFFSISSEIVLAEKTVGKGKHKHLGDVSKNDSCSIAEQRAKKDAIRNSSLAGERVSSEIYSNCSEVDGELECERNQFAIFSLNGIITRWTETNSNRDGVDGDVYFCEIEGKGKVEPIITNSDPSFHFNVELNREIFRSGEEMEIKINTTKEMFVYIFLWAPYSKNKNKAVTKLFPDINFNKNTNNFVNKSINLKYEVYFPEDIKKNKADEYLITVGSVEEIEWLSNYSLDMLKKQINKTKILMDKVNTSYIIIKDK